MVDVNGINIEAKLFYVGVFWRAVLSAKRQFRCAASSRDEALHMRLAV